MKFAHAAVIASLGLADGKRVSRSTQKKNELLRKAIPVNKDGSHRQLNGEWEVTGYNTIVFNDCLSLTWQNEDALDEDLVELTAAGTITPQTSYAIFQVINKETAYYQNGAQHELWMLPLADWIEATALTEFEEREDYCGACEASYDICYPEEDENAEYQGNQADYNNGQADYDGQEQDGGERKKKRFLKRQVTDKVKAHRESMNAIMGKRRFLDDECREYVDCYTCEAKGCFVDEEENENAYYCDEEAYQYGCEFEPDAVQNFMQEAACVDTGIVEYGANGGEIELKAGLMCNSDGSGVEMAMFVDDECSLYYTTKSFSSTMSGTYTYAILGEAASNIMDPYINSIDCLACEYMELCDENCDEGQEEANGEAPEASETCQNIMKEAVDVDTCGGAEKQYAENQYNGNNNGDGQYIPDIWYTYDFTDGEQPEGEDICFYLQGLDGEWSGKHIYNSDEKNGGGNFFDYKAAKNGGSSGNAGKTFGIILVVVVVIVAGVLIMQSMSKKSDSKKTPLVGQGGSMA